MKQAQPYINIIWPLIEKKMQCFEQVGFLRRCKKGICCQRDLKSSIETSKYEQCLKIKSEKKVMLRVVSDLSVQI